jgi:hypothetical protein
MLEERTEVKPAIRSAALAPGAVWKMAELVDGQVISTFQNRRILLTPGTGKAAILKEIQILTYAKLPTVPPV